MTALQTTRCMCNCVRKHWRLQVVSGCRVSGSCAKWGLVIIWTTAELLAGTEIHTLAKEIGTSVSMLEQHYIKLTATMAAGKLA